MKNVYFLTVLIVVSSISSFWGCASVHAQNFHLFLLGDTTKPVQETFRLLRQDFRYTAQQLNSSVKIYECDSLQEFKFVFDTFTCSPKDVLFIYSQGKSFQELLNSHNQKHIKSKSAHLKIHLNEKDSLKYRKYRVVSGQGVPYLEQYQLLFQHISGDLLIDNAHPLQNLSGSLLVQSWMFAIHHLVQQTSPITLKNILNKTFANTKKIKNHYRINPEISYSINVKSRFENTNETTLVEPLDTLENETENDTLPIQPVLFQPQHYYQVLDSANQASPRLPHFVEALNILDYEEMKPVSLEALRVNADSVLLFAYLRNTASKFKSSSKKPVKYSILYDVSFSGFDPQKHPIFQESLMNLMDGLSPTDSIELYLFNYDKIAQIQSYVSCSKTNYSLGNFTPFLPDSAEVMTDSLFNQKFDNQSNIIILSQNIRTTPERFLSELTKINLSEINTVTELVEQCIQPTHKVKTYAPQRVTLIFEDSLFVRLNEVDLIPRSSVEITIAPKSERILLGAVSSADGWLEELTKIPVQIRLEHPKKTKVSTKKIPLVSIEEISDNFRMALFWSQRIQGNSSDLQQFRSEIKSSNLIPQNQSFLENK